jgi:hypothetical protein
MKTCVFTPLHETGISVAHIVPYAGSHNTRLGRESSWLKVSSGTHFLRPLMVKGSFLRLTGGAAFLFRGKCKQPFPPAECAHPLLPLVPSLRSGPHALGRAHCQGAPVLPHHREPPPGIGAPEAGGPAGNRQQLSGCCAGKRPRWYGRKAGQTEDTPASVLTRQHACSLRRMPTAEPSKIQDSKVDITH